MAINWQVAEANENGTLLEFKEDDHKVWIRMSEKFTSKDTIPAQMIKRSINALTYQNDQAIMHMDYDQFLLTKEFLKK